MKRLFSLASLLFVCAVGFAQTKQLPKPDLQRKTQTVMKMFDERRSVREYSLQMLSDQDLSDLLWAAQGVNREDGRLTSPTAMNRQEIRLYVFTAKEASLYDPKTHSLTQVAKGDHRAIVASGQNFAKAAPVSLVMVADMEKFGMKGEQAQWMVGADAGIVTQNINLFCAAAGWATVTRGTMNKEAISKLLGLNENQIPVLNNPVGYMK